MGVTHTLDQRCGELPLYAQAIVDARKAGKKPESLVIVSIGHHGLHRIYKTHPVVIVDPSRPVRAWDFTFLAGLVVEIAADGSIDRDVDVAIACIDRILGVGPKTLRFWWINSGRSFDLVLDGLRVEAMPVLDQIVKTKVPRAAY